MWKKMLGLMLGLLILGVALASAAPEGTKWAQFKCASSTDPYSGRTYKVCNSAGLEYVAMYPAEEGKWVYVFRVGSVAESTASWGEPLPLIDTAGVRVEEVAGNNYFAIFSAPYDSEYAGAWPLSGTHDYSTFKKVAWDIMNLVVSQMNQKLGTALSVTQILKDLYVGVSSSSGGQNTDYVEVNWNVGGWNGTINATHYFQFDIKAHPGHLIEFKVKDRINYNPDSTAVWNVMIDVLPSPDDPEVLSMQSFSDRILNKLIGFYYTLRYHGEVTKFYITYKGQRIAFYKIQPNAIDKYTEKFGIPTEIAEKFKKSGKPFYFTKDPVGITVMPSG